MASGVRLADGSYDFSGGVDSGRVTTVQGPNNPNGLPRTMLAWLTNATVRGGGISQRTGWNPVCTVHPGTALFQGGFMYEPSFADPYLILSIGGRIYRVNVATDGSIVDLSAASGLVNPASVAKCFMAQGEDFLVIQAGDLAINNPPTLPLFWDGTTLRRSNGLTGNLFAPNINELPAAGPMVYYQGRLWYAQGRTYTAGDIVNGPSGTLAYRFKDAILKVTENPLAVGGDGFNVPDQAGDIRALAYTANLDTTLGQGPLYIFTRKQVYQLVVPVTRTAWIAAGADNQPVQTVAQKKYGTTSDRSVVAENGDLFYQSSEPAIRSLFVSVRFFQQWGNVPLSRNVNRVLKFNNRALMPFATGIEFDNRMLQAVLPVQTPVGVGFQAIVPLDFDIISCFGAEGQRPPPAWEGMWEGIDVLQLFEGDFGGRQRAFATVHSRVDDSIMVWELTDFLKFDNNGNRVPWRVESPAFTFQREFDMKQLDGGELWIDKIAGTVEMLVEYRTDADPCWQFWMQTQFCAAKDTCEDEDPICGYPAITHCEGQKFPITLPRPTLDKCVTMNKRPATIGYQFQVRVTLKGWCRIRGLVLFAIPVERTPFQGLNC